MPSELFAGLITDLHIITTPPDASDPYGDDPGFRLPGYGDVSVPKAIATWDALNIHFAVQLGDLVNGGNLGDDDEREANFDRLVAMYSGLTYPIHSLCGHWDAVNQTGFDQFFDSDMGIGSLIPTGDDAPANLWWSKALCTDESPLGYTVDKTVDGVTWTLIFMPLVYGTISFEHQGEITGPADKTCQEWLDERLAAAETAGNPVIIFSHLGFYTPDAPGSMLPTGYATAVASLEAQTIKPIVFQGHVHRSCGMYNVNGVTYCDLKGDVWGADATDTARFSHAVAKFTYPNREGQVSVELVGRGYQKSLNNRQDSYGVKSGSYSGGNPSSYSLI